MNGWHVLRTATRDDSERLERAAQRFLARHNLAVMGGRYVDSVEDHIAYLTSVGVSEISASQGRYLGKLWRRSVRRVLGPCAEGIAYGTVGYTERGGR